jgi:tetratricopeptide (TPR) repeat protein
MVLHLERRLPEATAAAEAALERFREDGDHTHEAVAHLTLGSIAYTAGETEKALEHDRVAVQAATQADDPRTRAAALHSLGLVLSHYGRVGESTAALEEALGLYRGLGDGRGEANVLGTLATTAAARGDSGVAVRWQEDAMPVLERLALPYELARHLGNLGMMLVRAGRADEAVEPLRRSVRLTEAQGTPAAIGFALVGLGQAQAARGRPEEALALCDRAAAVVGDAEPLMRAVVLHVRAEVLVASGRAEDALADLAQAEPTLRSSWSLAQLAELLVLRARVLRDRGDGEGARAALDEADETARRAGVLPRSPLRAAIAELRSAHGSSR